MRKELTMEEYENLTINMIINNDGTTNKKCPLCGNDVIVIEVGMSGTIKCKNENCFSKTYRGL